jgi:hypothetical protein
MWVRDVDQTVGKLCKCSKGIGSMGKSRLPADFKSRFPHVN